MRAQQSSDVTAAASDQRLFIAIACPPGPSVEAVLHELRTFAGTASGLRTVNRDTLHVTLKFLGGTPVSKIPAICAAMDAQYRDVAPFTLQLAGVGCFPGALWLGVCADPVLTNLASRTDNAMATLGFATETHAFHPHVTLARIKRNGRFAAAQWQERHQQTVWEELPVTAINLYRSVTRPEGAVYTVLHSSELKG